MPRTNIHSKNLQRAITQYLNEIELWFLHTALLLHVIFLYVKSEVTGFHTLEVMPRQKLKVKFTKGNNSKNRWNRVMVLVHCTCS